MCGIAGIFSINGQKIKNLKYRIKKMTQMLDHRGPDQNGIFVSNDNLCALGNTRLSIVNPNAKFQIPLISNNKNFAMTYNGEIFNYSDLQKQLESKKISIKNNTDSEVLLEGLTHFGEAFIDKLDGMWAFALYDIKRKKLLLSRDVLGERHIFYRIYKNQLIFASEPLPIIHDTKNELNIDNESIFTSIAFNSSAPGKTLVSNIHRMLPGRNIVASINKYPKEFLCRKLHPEKWFDFFSSKPNEKKIIDVFNEIMFNACRIRVPKEVPFNTTLSDGIDSALISTYCSNFGKKKINTIFLKEIKRESIHSIDTKLNEEEASLFSSSKLNSNHSIIKQNHSGNIKLLSEESKKTFDGFFDPSWIIFRQLANANRKKGCKVILIADGLDELLGGYPTDLQSWLRHQYFFDKKIFYNFLKLFSFSKIIRKLLLKINLEKFVIDPLENQSSFSKFYFSPIHTFGSHDMVNNIISNDSFKKLFYSFGSIDKIYDDILPELDFTQKIVLSYACKSLPDWFNLRSDKGFFGNAIECRLPFQNLEIIEFLIAMPASIRFPKQNQTKFLARKIVSKYIGSEIANRSKKGMPFSQSILVNEYGKDLNIQETLENSKIFQDLPFNKNTKKMLLNERYGLKKFLWTFFCLDKTYNNLKQINKGT